MNADDQSEQSSGKRQQPSLRAFAVLLLCGFCLAAGAFVARTRYDMLSPNTVFDWRGCARTGHLLTCGGEDHELKTATFLFEARPFQLALVHLRAVGVDAALPSFIVDSVDNPRLLNASFKGRVDAQESATDFFNLAFVTDTGTSSATPLRIYFYDPATVAISHFSVVQVDARAVGLAIVLLVLAFCFAPFGWYVRAISFLRAAGRRLVHMRSSGSLVIPLLVFTILTSNVLIAHPIVFADEYAYAVRAKFGNHTTLGLAPVIPNLLFMHLFSFAHRFGDSFYVAAKLLNGGLFALASVLVRAVLSRVTKRTVASILALVICTGPVSIYAAFFMPESMYFCGFWVLAYCFVRFAEQPGAWSLARVAAALALLALVKPHALALIAPIVLLSAARLGLRKLAVVLVLPPVFYLVWFCAANLLNHGVLYSPTGTLYAGASRSMVSATALSKVVPLLLHFAANHFALVILLFGAPLCLAFATVVDRSEQSRRRQFIAASAVLTLATIMCMAIKYSADIGPFEGINRVHGRYYDFALPLLLLPLLASASRASRDSERVIAAVFAVGIVVSYLVARGLAPNLVDYPEAYGLGLGFFEIALVANLCILLLWALGRETSVAIFLCFISVFSVVTKLGMWNELRRRPALPVDTVGIVAQQLDEGNQRNRTYAVQAHGDPGSDADTFRLGFYSLALSSFSTHPDSRTIVCDDIPTGTRTVVARGELKIACDFDEVFSVADVRLLRRRDLVSR